MKSSSLLKVGGVVLATLLSQYAIAVEDEDVNLYDVQDLYNTCAVKPEAPDYVVTTFACRGFIGGAVQYHDAVSDRKHLKRLICYPKTATVEDGRDAFVAWGEKNLNNKERMGEAAVIGLVRALAEKYPCK